MNDLPHIKERRRLSRFGGRILFAIIAIEVDIKEPRVGGFIKGKAPMQEPTGEDVQQANLPQADDPSLC